MVFLKTDRYEKKRGGHILGCESNNRRGTGGPWRAEDSQICTVDQIAENVNTSTPTETLYALHTCNPGQYSQKP